MPAQSAVQVLSADELSLLIGIDLLTPIDADLEIISIIKIKI